VFPGMTVMENVLVGAHRTLRKSAAAQMLWLPSARREEQQLRARAEHLLSIVGLSARRDRAATDLPMGSQKLLEVLRALMAAPRLLLMDEPSMGLAPLFVEEIFAIIGELKRGGTTILLVEQNAQQALSRSDRAYILETGEVVTTGSGKELLVDPAVKQAYLGVA